MSPRDQERLFDPFYGKELLRIAQGDLASTRVLLRGLEVSEGRSENVFYTAQQAIEKALKAVLCARGLPVPLVHDIGILMGRLPDDTHPTFDYGLTRLTQFATTRRYEEGRIVLTIEEARDTVAMAALVLDWAAQLVGV